MKFESPYKDLFNSSAKSRYRFEISIDYADKEIIEELERHPNKSEFVRELIRKQIKKGD